MAIQDHGERQHNTTHHRIFNTPKNLSVKFSTSFFPYITKKYELLPISCRVNTDKDLFKQEFKNHISPKRYKILSMGTKVGCKLLTQIKVGMSYLNSHSYTVGKTPSPECVCHFLHESPTHFFLECFLYNEERRTLLSTFEHFIPNFKNFSKKKMLDTILLGYNIDNTDIYETNVSLQLATQKYI